MLVWKSAIELIAGRLLLLFPQRILQLLDVLFQLANVRLRDRSKKFMLVLNTDIASVFVLSPLIIILDDTLLPSLIALRTRALTSRHNASRPSLSTGSARDRRSMARFGRFVARARHGCSSY
jgi:hypothetical protein